MKTNRAARWICTIMFAGALLVAAAALAFFLIGLGDGSVSAFNLRLWLGLLAGVGGVLGGGWWLRARGHVLVAAAVFAVLALPGILYALFVVLVIVLAERWN